MLIGKQNTGCLEMLFIIVIAGFITLAVFRPEDLKYILGIVGILIGIGLWLRHRRKTKEGIRTQELKEYYKKVVRCPNCGHQNYRWRITTEDMHCNRCGSNWNPAEYGQIYDER